MCIRGNFPQREKGLGLLNMRRISLLPTVRRMRYLFCLLLFFCAFLNANFHSFPLLSQKKFFLSSSLVKKETGRQAGFDRFIRIRPLFFFFPIRVQCEERKRRKEAWCFFDHPPSREDITEEKISKKMDGSRVLRGGYARLSVAMNSLPFSLTIDRHAHSSDKRHCGVSRSLLNTAP